MEHVGCMKIHNNLMANMLNIGFVTDDWEKRAFVDGRCKTEKLVEMYSWVTGFAFVVDRGLV